MPSILPELTLEESLKISKVYSACGLLAGKEGLMTERPFRSPHHTVSANALTGGGRKVRPGEISLATRTGSFAPAHGRRKGGDQSDRWNL